MIDIDLHITRGCYFYVGCTREFLSAILLMTGWKRLCSTYSLDMKINNKGIVFLGERS